MRWLGTPLGNGLGCSRSLDVGGRLLVHGQQSDEVFNGSGGAQDRYHAGRISQTADDF